MELNGKVINFLGDSITQGVGTSSPSKTTFHALIAKSQNAVCRNYGVGGTRIARQSTFPSEQIHDADFIFRAQSMDDADIVVVFGGTNDYGHGDAPFGEFSDRTEYSFYGALHILIQDLINKYPKSTIVFMTPLHRSVENQPNKRPLCAYVSAIKEVCAYYAVPLLDLYSLSGMQPAVEINKVTYMPDGLHPNDEGHKLIASRLVGFLKSL